MELIAVLHTRGQNLSLHPHLHCIVPAGGVTKSGNWKSTKSKGKFLFDVKAMSKVYRAKFVMELRNKLPNLAQELYDKLFEKQWVVYAKQPFGRPENVIEYLRRYSHKIAISNHRILKIDKDNHRVIFQHKEYRNGGKKTTLNLSNKEFIRRFSMHILPKGFTRIRHYGILSGTWKKDKLLRLQNLLTGNDNSRDKTPKQTHRKRCPICKKGKLVTLVTFSGRGPQRNWRTIFKTDIKL